MFTLARSSRTLLATCAFASFSASFVTTPFAASGAPGTGVTATPLAAPLATSSAPAIVIPHRDPFAGEPAALRAGAPAAASPASTTPGTATAMLPPLPSIPGAIQPLPPNAGALGSGLPFGPAPRVTALITGAHPFALVDEAGTTRVVTIGDRIDGDTIVAIAPTGIRLARGQTLTVSPSPAAAPVVTASGSGGRLP